MRMDPEVLGRHFEYTRWASVRVLEAAAKLPSELLAEDCGNSFGGILDTLIHIFRADRVWLKRCQGEATASFAPAGEELTLETLKADWPILLENFATWVRAQDEAALNRQLQWVNLKGEAKSELLYKILLHVVNHGTYHRGQIITMIRQAGGEVVATDLLYYPGM